MEMDSLWPFLKRGLQAEREATPEWASSRGYGHATTKLPALLLATLGVVFGDIGTSPLYALSECFHGEHAVPRRRTANVLGVLSLIFWALIVVVSVKYLRLRHARRQPAARAASWR